MKTDTSEKGLETLIMRHVAIKSQTHPLTTAIARTEREIALMQEYRMRLTADIVTRKLDLRETAAKSCLHRLLMPNLLPDEPLEDIATEETEE